MSDDALRQRRESILGTTLTLVAELGAGNVRLRDVAARAEVSVGTLQHYFITRDQMLREAFSQHARWVVDQLHEAARSESDPWNRIQLLIQTITQSPDYLQRCALWIDFGAASLRDPDLRLLMEQAYDGWRHPLLAAVEEGTRTGIFRPALPPEAVVTNLLALIDGYEFALALEISGVTREHVADQLRNLTGALLGVRVGAVEASQGS